MIEITGLNFTIAPIILTVSWCFGEEGEDSFSGKQGFEAGGDSYKKLMKNVILAYIILFLQLIV